jgi:hypothetical protein
MKKMTFIALFAMILSAYSQDYDGFIKKADSCYAVKNYTLATTYFQNAFATKPELKKNFYNAACAASLANNKKKALQWFETAVDNGFDNVNHINTDTDLDFIRKEKKFIKIVAALQKKADAIEANYDKPLQKELLEIYREDQEIRKQYVAAQKKYKYQGKEMDGLGAIMDLKDSLNLQKIVKILDEKGWVGKDKVGQQANQTLFLVIQHSDLKIQQKYLPMMRAAVKKGNANSGNLALLEDRIALREGRKQIYGSQIGTHPETKTQYVLPLEDPDNVDKRRAEVGLEPLADYVKFWNIIWDLEKYKKELPEIEKISKSKN